MIKKEILLLVSLLFISIQIYAQKVDSDETINCIKEGVIIFFIDIERLNEGNDIKDLYDNVGMIEISENKNLGYQRNGVYRITDFTTHRANYLLLKKGKKFKILTLLSLNQTFNDLSFFLEELGYSKDDSFKYLELVLNEVKENNKTKWLNQIAPREQQWTSCN
ncbi:hypothetical protein [Gelidibacter japonicus]|uniref:hypothetical protein n=1 Tax=Gelidibacter japonicus TaxID=1962232 RepID=UPI003A904985